MVKNFFRLVKEWGGLLHALAQCFCIAVTIYLLLPNTFFYGLVSDIDGSFQMALQRALLERYSFGSDVFYPFGPLGFLVYRLPIGDVFLSLLAFDLFLFAALTYALISIQCELRSSKVALFLLGAAFLSTEHPNHLDALYLLLLLQVFFALRYVRLQRLSSLLLLLGLTALLALIKINFLFGSLFVFAFAIAASFLRNRSAVASIASLVGLVSLISVLCLLTNTDFFGYVVTGAEFCSGFLDSMYLYDSKLEWSYGLGVVCLCLYGAFFLRSSRDFIRNPAQFLMFSACFFAFMVLYKTSFTRGDTWHVYPFFYFAPFLFALSWYSLSSRILRRRFATAVSLSLVFTFAAFHERFTVSYLKGRLSSVPRYISQLSGSRPSVVKIVNFKELDPELLELIGLESVDMIPRELSYSYFYNLNYQPRPVIQSFKAYSLYLDRMNEAHFLSSDAPRFLIFEHQCIDGRYCFNDALRERLAIARAYHVVRSYGERLLLEKRSKSLGFLFEDPRDDSAQLGDWIRLENRSGKLLFVEADVRYSFLGWLMRMLLRPPQLTYQILLRDSSGEARVLSYRMPVQQLRGGILVSHFANSISAQQHFLRGELSRLRKIEAVRFTSAVSWGFEPQISLSLLNGQFVDPTVQTLN